MTINSKGAAGRLEALRKRMEEKGIDAALIWDPDNQYYLSGFRAISYSRPIIYIVHMDKTQYILPELEKDHATEKNAADDLLLYYEKFSDRDKHTTYVRPLNQVTKDMGTNFVLGIETEILPAAVYELLKEKGLAIKDVGADLVEMRAVKDKEEIFWLEQAGYLSDVALKSSFDNLHTGMSELEFDAHGDRKLLETASQKYPDLVIGFENWTCSGPERSAMPHLYSSTRKFAAGDVVVHSRQVWVNQYRAENERTFLIGNPSEEKKRYLELAIEAQQAAIKAVKPGVRAKEVDLAAFKIFEDAGCSKYVQHRTGHGLGLTEHEEPYLRFDNELILKEGMVYTIEPGIYVPGTGGFRHSDTIIVTAGGCRSITNFPGKIEEMIFN